MLASASPLPSFGNATDLIARGNGGHHGIASFYFPDGDLGACGTPIQNGDNALALSDGEWQGGDLCGKSIRIINLENGRTVENVIVRDHCPGCQKRGSKNDIDLTSGVFAQLDDLNKGLIKKVEWFFQD